MVNEENLHQSFSDLNVGVNPKNFDKRVTRNMIRQNNRKENLDKLEGKDEKDFMASLHADLEQNDILK